MDKNVHSESEFNSLLTEWREAGAKLVFTNGCFDLLHPGHVQYLSDAKALGDKLIIGVNSDLSVQNLKGPNRPINSLKDRLIMLNHLSSTDLLVSFNEDTPINLIKFIKPDILVKGGDYTFDSIVGAKFTKERGGQVIVLPFLKGYSSTKIINQIKKLS